MSFILNSWSVKEDFDEVKLKLEILNFSSIMDNINNGDKIRSKLFDIGRSEFTLRVFPISGGLVEENMDDRNPALKIDFGPFCPTCKITFMGREFGVEAFTREIFGDDQI